MDLASTDDWDAAFAAIVDDGPLIDPWDDHLDALIDEPADRTERLAGRPGVDLVRSLAEVNPRRLDPREALSYARATERAIAWLQMLQAESLVSVAGPKPQVDVHSVDDAVITIEDAARSEVAAALRWPESMAHDRITTARLLCGPLLLTRTALAAGEITYRHAEVVSATAQRVSSFAQWPAPDGDDRLFTRACKMLQEDVLPVARSRDVAATRRRAERSLQRRDAEHAEHRRKQARRTRDVWVQAEPDGMALLCARLGIAEAHACLSVIDGIARTPAHPPAESADPTNPNDEERSIGARRADALMSVVLASPDAPTPSPVRAHVDIVIDLPTLLGLHDGCATMRGAGPGGPIPVSAAIVRELVRQDGSATMRRLVADPLTGHLLDRGRSTYAIPDALRSFIQVRDGTCRFPGCNRRADLGQIDHAIAWQDGGCTDIDNLGVLCVRHHHLKTFAGWSITRSGPDGSVTWRSPAGMTYDLPPPGLLSDG